MKRHDRIVRQLLKKDGIDLNAKDNNGRTPLSWAAENMNDQIVRQLLKDGIDLNSKDNNGRTPLSWASLSSLEVLHLSSSFQVGWRHDWPIRHDTIISRLKPLRGLRRVAFTRDAYSYSREGQLFEYASYIQLRNDAWELHHRCMRAEALSYAKAFPKLEFIHIGKISFKVSRVKYSLELEATDDKGFSWMRSMFGISG
jgi:hypothetical protein